MTEQIPAVILARVSDISQKDGYSPDAQLANSHAYAGRKNMKVVEIYSITESSTKRDRPEFERMLTYISKQKKRTALIVDCVDRLNRNFTHHPVLFALIEKDLLEIHFVREGYSIDKDSNSMQKMMFNMGTVMAQSYVDQLKDNIKRSLKQKLDSGHWIAKAPVGYRHEYAPDDIRSQGVYKKTDRKDRRRSKIVLDPVRAPLVQRMFMEYATGTVSFRELQRKTVIWGLRTDKGKELSLQTVCDIINNPFYYGVMKVKDKLYQHNHPTIIEMGLHLACQAVSNRSHNKPWAASKETRRKFLLRGMVTCAISGNKATCDFKKGRYTYLMVRDPAVPAKKLWVKEEKVISQIEAVIQSLSIPEEYMPDIIDYIRNSHEAEKAFHHEHVHALELEKNTLATKLNRLTDLLVDGHIEADVYNRKLVEIDTRRTNINTELNQTDKGDSAYKMGISNILALMSKMPGLFRSSKTDEKRTLLGLVFSNLQLEGPTLRYTLRKPLEQFIGTRDCQEWCALRDSNPRPAA